MQEMSSEESSVEMCVLCCREIEIYAVGQCDHPVCHECSARMRVLCEQNECPICRGDMAYVLFTHEKQPFSSLHSFTRLDKRYMIAFEDKMAQEAFQELLKHICKSCGESFDTFKKLDTHVRRQHNMQYCVLCVESLKIFTFERKFYSRKDLAHHNRRGDIDDTSHRGHPLCDFCSQRFVDHDERFRHMRREHFFCHFCDADGIHQYYNDYCYLRDHFRKEHFLCEEGECAKEQQFISSAFRSKIDLQAHKALAHSKNKTKAEAKQARTLDFEFAFVPRTLQNGERSPSNSDYRRGRYRAQLNQQRPQSAEESLNSELPGDVHDTRPQETKNFNACSSEEFPTLSGEQDEESNSSMWLRGQYGVQNQQKKAEDFPALAPLTSSLRTSSTKSSQSRVAKSPWNDPQRLGKLSRPGSAESSEKARPRPQATMKVTRSEEEFPRLETKKAFGNMVEPVDHVHREPETQKQWPVSISSQTAEQLGQEIYSKCKSKKKKKKASTSETDSFSAENKPPVKPVNPADLSKAYSGIGDRNTNENEENLDPLKLAKDKCLQYERPRKVEDNSNDTPWAQKPKFVADDFPPLDVPESKTKGPPGFVAPVISSLPVPPPGFSSKTQSKVKTLGSGMSLKSVAEQLKSENVVGDGVQNKRSYEYPPRFKERNNVLTDMIYELLDSSNESFEKFRILSGSFRKDKISAQEYHTQCVSMLGREKFHKIFTELVCLLPDISKQQELLSVHNKFLKDESKIRGAVPKNRLSNHCAAIAVTSCPVCQQVLTNTDYVDHHKSHKDEMIR